MNIKLADILDIAELQQAVIKGHVKRQRHSSEPLEIINYTQTCMWERAWTPTTMACRGIVWRPDTGEVVARPFCKFFNHGEPEAGNLDLTAAAEVFDKADGSLGILYPLPSGGWAVATRGSFASDQAQHATALLNALYGDFKPMDGLTYLFEIVYPNNRIVVNYGDLDDLIFLAAIDNRTGRTVAEYGLWPGRSVAKFPFATLAQALHAPPRANAEGLVVRFTGTDLRVKIKQDDYKAMHRLLTGTTPRRLWEFLCVAACKDHVAEIKHWSKLGLDPERAAEILAAGAGWFEAMIRDVPDEFAQWAKSIIGGIEGTIAKARAEAQGGFGALAHLRHDRKQFAAAAGRHPHAAALFSLLDGKQIETYLWKLAYPAADRGWISRSEDVA